MYRVPLEDWGKAARRLAVAAKLDAHSVSLSCDGQDWQPAEIGSCLSGIAFFNIPQALVSGEWLYLRIASPEKQETRIYGISFLTTTP